MIYEYLYYIQQDSYFENYNIDTVNIDFLHGYSGVSGHKKLNCNGQVECLKTAIQDFELDNEILKIYIFNGQTGGFWFDILSENHYETYYLYEDKVKKLLFKKI